MAKPPRAKVDPTEYATIKSIRGRIRKAFLNHIGQILTNDDLKSVARDPISGVEPENWHQRLSELRTDEGYTILTSRDMADLKVGEYLLLVPTTRPTAAKRVRPSDSTWAAVLSRGGRRCEWDEAGLQCGLADLAVDPVGGGTVRLTPDHLTPHAMNPATDVTDASKWRALCGRHQVIKKNYWDNLTGKLNVHAILQDASESVKRDAYEFLKNYFADR